MKEVSTAYLWISIIVLSTYYQFSSANSEIKENNKSETNNSVNINSTTVNQPIVEANLQNRSIVQITLTLKDGTVLPYVRDEIFYRSNEHNVTTEDLIELTDIRFLGYNDTLEKLRYLNISQDVFTVNNFKLLLDFANMTFVEFYEKLKTGPNITAPALLEAMQALNIDTANFSVAIVYGPQDRVYDVLNKGVYTKENWDMAFKKLGIDMDTFFINVKDLILDQIMTKDLAYYDKKLPIVLPLFGKKMYNDVWEALNVTLIDIYLVPSLRNIIEKLYLRVNLNTTLGVATSSHEITVHKKIFDNIEEVLRLVNINAQSVAAPEIIHQNLVLKSEKRVNLATLWNNKSMSINIEILKELSPKHDENCTYVTINGGQIVENSAKILNTSHTSLNAEIENGAMFNLGNPLICQGKLVGMATSDRGNNSYVFDTFDRTEKVVTSGSHHTEMVPGIFLFLIVLYSLRLIY